MAQTKRKRQTKHRGNAAGRIETRGRTGRPLSADERKKVDRAKAREARLNRPPTWKGSFQRALLAGGFMFLFLLLVHSKKEGNPLITAIEFAAFAIALYTPGGYYMESYMYKRRMAKKQQQQQRR